MAGEMVELMVKAATLAAAMQSDALATIEDQFGGDPTIFGELLGIRDQLDAEAHVLGGGFDGCPLCMRMLELMPDIVQQALAAGGDQNANA